MLLLSGPLQSHPPVLHDRIVGSIQAAAPVCPTSSHPVEVAITTGEMWNGEPVPRAGPEPQESRGAIREQVWVGVAQALARCNGQEQARCWIKLSRRADTPCPWLTRSWRTCRSSCMISVYLVRFFCMSRCHSEPSTTSICGQGSFLAGCTREGQQQHQLGWLACPALATWQCHLCAAPASYTGSQMAVAPSYAIKPQTSVVAL